MKRGIELTLSTVILIIILMVTALLLITFVQGKFTTLGQGYTDMITGATNLTGSLYD